MGCFTTNATTVPGETPEELRIRQEEINALDRQVFISEQFQPFILDELGFGQDANGNFVRLPDTQDEITKGLEERMLAGLGGGNVSPALEADIGRQGEALEERLARSGGRYWEGTTAGLKSMDMFNTSANLLREESRRSDLANTSAMLSNRQNTVGSNQQRSLQNMVALGSPPGSTQFQSILQPFQANRNLQTSANAQGGQSTGLAGSLSTLAGSIIGGINYDGGDWSFG